MFNNLLFKSLTQTSFRTTLLLTFILFLSCASPPLRVANGVKSWIDFGSIEYGTDPNQYVEVTVPQNNNQSGTAFLYIHGYGNKMVDLTFLEEYRKDYIIGKLDYRYLRPKRHDLSMDNLLSDLHNGLKALKDTLEINGINVNKVILMGNSLGATLALLYSYTFFDISPIPITFCVTMSGLTDMTDAMILQSTEHIGKRLIQKYLLSIGSILSGTELFRNDITALGFSNTAIEAFKKISPIQYINGDSPPTIIVHNTNDRIIPFSNAQSLNHVLNTYNVPHIFIQSVTKIGHKLGTNISNRNGYVFAPVNARSSVTTPKRYTRKLHPLLEEKLIESINQYIIEYCQ